MSAFFDRKRAARAAARARAAYPVPPVAVAQQACSLDPDDFVLTCATQGSDQSPPLVTIATQAGGLDGFVMLAPRDARAFAAGILNAADLADGLEPIFLVPGLAGAPEAPES